jgi:hypothetical protein
MARDINLGPTGGPYVNLQENSGDLDITGATNVDLNGASLTNGGITEGFDTIDVFEADGTFDASNVDFVYVECVGGGGGAGDIDITTETVGTAGAGGGGGYAAAYKDVSATSSITVTVGAGGTTAASGGDSTFQTSTQVIGNGGGGGTSAPNAGSLSGGSGGSGQGDITIPGGDGGDGNSTTDAINDDAVSVTGANGGDSVLGSGGAAVSDVNSITNGLPGKQYGGGGGSGAMAVGATGTQSDLSATGAQGVVIVYYKA